MRLLLCFANLRYQAKEIQAQSSRLKPLTVFHSGFSCVRFRYNKDKRIQTLLVEAKPYGTKLDLFNHKALITAILNVPKLFKVFHLILPTFTITLLHIDKWLR